MSDPTAGQGVQAVVAARVDGRIAWGECPVRCPNCGTETGLLLQVHQAGPTAQGEVASAVCPEGHGFEHPLVYPKFVRLVAKSAPGSVSPEALAEIAWGPHKLDTTGESLPDGSRTIISYTPWTSFTLTEWPWRNPVPERERWPELVRAWESAACSR